MFPNVRLRRRVEGEGKEDGRRGRKEKGGEGRGKEVLRQGREGRERKRRWEDKRKE